MIIKRFADYSGDLELRWLSGIFSDFARGLRIKTLFGDATNGETVSTDLPFAMLPFLMPGLVVSNGEVQAARRTGQHHQVVLPDLSKADDLAVMEAIPRNLYNLGGHRGGGQRVLRYECNEGTLLLPAIELVRFLFLHSRVLAEALLRPSGLLDLAVTPTPGLCAQAQIDFTDRVPRRLLTPDFVKEFAWLSVHPDGRRAWDSVLERSQGRRFLVLDPPMLRNCHIEFRGVAWRRQWLVLEILALSGRVLPAPTVLWTHPTEHDRSGKITDGSKDAPDSDPPAETHAIERHEQVLDTDEDSQPNTNQDVVLLGGKRGCFDNGAKVIKVLRPCRTDNLNRKDTTEDRRKSNRRRSNYRSAINHDIPPVVVKQTVSAGEPALSGGHKQIDFAILERSEPERIGELRLLEKILLRIEASQSDFTLTRRWLFLKRGKAVSVNNRHRRACLLAVFTAPTRPPRVVLDVAHGNLHGLSGLLLRYNAPCPLAKVEAHSKILLDALVDKNGHWDREAETELLEIVRVQRLRRLARMTDRGADEDYVVGWVEKLGKEILG
ncbi:MAG: hypothetical protein B7X48_11660 [Acidiphilium sp. 34-60-192]|nr:MAG: hypothetical protein B7X48_11660 [Acidiphilium sp. 34-60-192]